MSNDSTARGYLTPVGANPNYDEALEREDFEGAAKIRDAMQRRAGEAVEHGARDRGLLGEAERHGAMLALGSRPSELPSM